MFINKYLFLFYFYSLDNRVIQKGKKYYEETNMNSV